MIFDDSYKAFIDICYLITENNTEEANKRVKEFILDYVGITTSNEALLSHIIATSMLKRIDRELLETKNIYLQEFDIPQIVLFYKMAEAYPHVALSHDIANQYIKQRIKDLASVTIFDIGIGKGKQLGALIQSLKNSNNYLKQMNIIGLDPDNRNLADSKDLFDELKRTTDFRLEFYPICNVLESCTPFDFAQIKKISEGNLIINSTFAMHHIQHPINDYEARTETFRKLAELKPILFTLAEPNSNHDIENLTKRLHNCWSHFGLVFELVDRSNIGPEHKFLIKEKFFGREIRNMFEVCDYLRCERHETYDSWMLRLIKAHFVPYSFRDITISMPDYCSYKISDGFVELGYNSVLLVGVFAYQIENSQ